MSNYTKAFDELSFAMMSVTVDGPEWTKLKAAMNALDEARVAEIQADFARASQGIAGAATRLQAIIDGTDPDPASAFLKHVTTALDALMPIAKNVDALLSGEPATPLPGMAVTNQADFPAPGQHITPPIKQKAGAPIALTALRAGAVAPTPRTVDQMIDQILEHEGGFVNHPNDRGGPTNFGITLRTLAAWRRPQLVDMPDVRALKVFEARKIYATNYYTGPGIDKLPAAIQPVMFDMSLNHGPGTAVRLLQRLLDDSGYSCSVDGGIGDETIQQSGAADAAMGIGLINGLVDRRIALFEEIVARDESQRVFLKGWLNRARQFAV